MENIINFYVKEIFGFKANVDVLVLKVNEIEVDVPVEKAAQIACLVAKDTSYTGEMALWCEQYNTGRNANEFICICKIKFEKGKPISNHKAGIGFFPIDAVNLGEEV